MAHASRIEDTSNVVLEALACGRSLLVAAESGAGRHVVDGETGLVIENNDADAWAQALRRVACDETLRARLGHRAAQWADRGIASWHEVLREDLLAVWERARAAKRHDRLTPLSGESLHPERSAASPRGASVGGKSHPERSAGSPRGAKAEEHGTLSGPELSLGRGTLASYGGVVRCRSQAPGPPSLRPAGWATSSKGGGGAKESTSRQTV